jgi:hypothetical protein
MIGVSHRGVTDLVHENLEIVMTFAFSRPALKELIVNKFHGEWKYLSKACFEMPEARANRALLELAILLRLIDDHEKTPDYIKKSSRCGKLIREGGRETKLDFRGASSKIVHAAEVEWQFPEPDRPTIICRPYPPEQWRAEIDVRGLAAFCGGIMS